MKPILLEDDWGMNSILKGQAPSVIKGTKFTNTAIPGLTDQISLEYPGSNSIGSRDKYGPEQRLEFQNLNSNWEGHFELYSKIAMCLWTSWRSP